jgi:uncharacterized membrane protein
MSVQVDPPPFVFLSRPNRSLGPVARRWALLAIAATPIGLAAAAAAFGAWPILPFAGLEVALLALAFHIVGSHDADFERLEIRDHEVTVEARDASKHTRFVAHRQWARLVLRERGRRCTLGLAYAGRTVELGRMLSDEGRRRLAEDLRRRLPVTAA